MNFLKVELKNLTQWERTSSQNKKGNNIMLLECMWHFENLIFICQGRKYWHGPQNAQFWIFLGFFNLFQINPRWIFVVGLIYILHQGIFRVRLTPIYNIFETGWYLKAEEIERNINHVRWIFSSSDNILKSMYHLKIPY